MGCRPGGTGPERMNRGEKRGLRPVHAPEVLYVHPYWASRTSTALVSMGILLDPGQVRCCIPSWCRRQSTSTILPSASRCRRNQPQSASSLTAGLAIVKFDSNTRFQLTRGRIREFLPMCSARDRIRRHQR